MNFKDETSKLNIDLTPQMENKFSLYYENLIRVNSYMNLTSITSLDEVYIKHFYDSLTILKALESKTNITLCDVGSGAGFPSIPLAIVRDDISVTIIDALNKRINFLNELKDTLGLNNVSALHKRAEDYVKEARSSFDIVCARAVARLNVLCELCLPLTKIGGCFIAMKGDKGKEELDEAYKAIEILGGKVKEVISLDLPNDSGYREIIVIEKIKECNFKYPRQFAKIKERPL
ncbi:MAG: 16S rRNA (guanine(527)-N(7))-methyltransferase RsmG [Acholeplasmatales bacterium]|nr:16S rRNA (guanine(527)-N(7))-methyltransferase RsmG [Acholeplasmatales bacterium]